MDRLAPLAAACSANTTLSFDMLKAKSTPSPRPHHDEKKKVNENKTQIKMNFMEATLPFISAF
jgi:hypothetical protein